MARKMGDAVVLLILFTFLIGGFTNFLLWADFSTGVTSGVQANLDEISSESRNGTQDVESETSTAFYTEGTYVPQGLTVQDTRASETIGITDVFTHNVLFKLINSIGQKLSVPPLVTSLLLSLLTLTLIILTMRFFQGETKI